MKERRRERIARYALKDIKDNMRKIRKGKQEESD